MFESSVHACFFCQIYYNLLFYKIFKHSCIKCVSVYSLVKYLKVKVVYSFNLVLVIQSVLFYCRHRMSVAEL